MPGPHKGVSTQHTTQQQFAKPRHQPSNRDQQARDRLKNKAKIKSCAYIQLGEKALQTVHQTFEPNIPVIFHLPALDTKSNELQNVKNLQQVANDYYEKHPMEVMRRLEQQTSEILDVMYDSVTN